MTRGSYNHPDYPCGACLSYEVCVCGMILVLVSLSRIIVFAKMERLVPKWKMNERKGGESAATDWISNSRQYSSKRGTTDITNPRFYKKLSMWKVSSPGTSRFIVRRWERLA